MENKEVQGYVHQVESFGAADGPGVRYIIFLSGCPFRCLYCHNPDTWDTKHAIPRHAKDLIQEALSCREYWGAKGGITVSGGEPLTQMDFLLELFKLAKEEKISTCIDTAGGPFQETGEFFTKFQKLMEVTDLLLMDIKHIDPAEHKKLTGKTKDNVTKMFYYLDKINKPIWIRHVLVPGITDKDEYLKQTRDFIRTLNNVYRVEVLPYHGLGAIKYKDLGIPYALEKTLSPTIERVNNARTILECDKYTRWQE